jgi:hypothetical protein
MPCVPSNPASACEVGALEGFEIVRRRLFTPVKDETAREQTCLAYSRLYGGDSADFPRMCAEAQYLERLRAVYPIAAPSRPQRRRFSRLRNWPCCVRWAVRWRR